MEDIKTNNNCIFSWCPEIEVEAFNQMVKLAEMPYAKYCALMPDAHRGQNMPIGGVLATKDVVVPDAVGVDIGCGMCAVKSDLQIDKMTDNKAQELFERLSGELPVGFSHNTLEQKAKIASIYKEKFNEIANKTAYSISCVDLQKYNPFKDLADAFYSQLGSLGGGNHFLEVQSDEAGYVWLMIHSGSRNIGKRIGDLFNKKALELNNLWFSEGREIPFLPVDSEAGKIYLAWMEFALQFAFLNRQVMLTRAMESVEKIFPKTKWIKHDGIDDYSVGAIINIHHNFAALENHFGQNWWVHRKGATRAYEGMTGIIPGSMGSSSYIVKGLGNKRSLMSCSHGAGRKMGRLAFSRQMKDSHKEIEESLEGVLHTDFGTFKYGKSKGLKDVSEAPAAYKDINQVMDNQKDLVKIIVSLKPHISVKG